MTRKNNNDVKRCTKCNATHNVDAFYRDKSQKDGRSSWCKSCEKSYNNAYYSTLKTLNVTRKKEIVDDEKSRAKFDRAMKTQRVTRRRKTTT